MNRAKRIQQKENYAKKQMKIAKRIGSTLKSEKHVEHAAMDCGTPNCFLCGNRRLHDGLTYQERKLFQDVDK